jgi:RNA polymerase sigma-70 factor (ECF subfamily)
LFVITSHAQGADAPAKSPHFQTTHWSIVMTAGQGDPARRAEALEILCRTYWYPLYAHVRQRGLRPEDAQDLTQEFLAQLIEKNWLANLDPHPSAGRFRSFLLTALDRFLINDYDRTHAAKRGGGRQLLSLDKEQAEGRFLKELATDDTPEKNFDRRWALATLDASIRRLRAETAVAGKTTQFELLDPFLSREAEAGEYAQIAEQLGLSVGAVGVAVHRLRQRYREVVRVEIANTVADFGQVDEEMRHLVEALGG